MCLNSQAYLLFQTIFICFAVLTVLNGINQQSLALMSRSDIVTKYMATSIRSLILVLLALIGCVAEEWSVFLILMEGEPAALYKSPHGTMPELRNGTSELVEARTKELVLSHNELLQSSLKTGSYNKLYSFTHVINGFAIHTTPSQAKKLKEAAGVKHVERDGGSKLKTTYTPQFLDLPERVWTEEGGDKNAGDGVVIGLIDTGINPLHPSFAYDLLNPFKSNVSHFSGACQSGPGFPPTACNGKIVSAKFFSAGAQAIATLNTSVDFLSPLDAVGHGSHVASIAAGNNGVPVVVNGFYYGRASGMAPRARIAVYKALYPTVGTMADVIAAMDEATRDGVDILTLSVGPDEPPEDTPTFLSVFEVFMLFAQRAGITVVQAAGNHGPDLSTVVAYSPWAIAVAAATTDRSYPGSLILGNGQKVGGVGLSGPTLGEGMLVYNLVLAQDALKPNGTFPRTAQYVEECQYPEAFDPNVVRGSIVICTFSDGFYNGVSTINAIVDTARSLGFLGFAFLANPNYGDFIAEAIPFAVPGIMIPKVADAQIIRKYYDQQTHRDKRGIVTKFCATAAIGEGRIATFGGRAPVVSRFSSRGPDFVDIEKHLADVLKPDILAPGHQIWGAWSPISALDPILKGYSFALLSGTSMATPHVVGITALIKQRNPSWNPSMIASAISTTATHYDNYGEEILAQGYEVDSVYPSTHFDFGAGFVNPARAIDPGLVLSVEFQDYARFLCSMPNIDPTSIKAAIGIQCNISRSHPADLNLPSVTISALRGTQTILRSFKNVGGKPETYLCSVIPPNGTTVTLSPTWFRISPQGIQVVEIKFQVIQAVGKFGFGEIVLTGSLNHIVRIPLSILSVSMA